MDELGFVTIWRSQKEVGSCVSLHTHNYYELVYYHTGSGDTTICGSCHGFSSRTLVLIPPGVPHDERHRIGGELYCLSFRSENPFPVLLRQDPDGQILRLLRDLLEESTRQAIGYRNMIRAKLLELSVLLCRAGSSDSASPKNFEYTIGYLRENYHQKIVFSDLAQDLNLSYDYFQHRFKQLMGVSPQRFLLDRRLEAACRMLRDSSCSCTEIAYRCGFSNSSQFSMVFRREYGLTPRQFRQKTDFSLP